MGTGPNKPTLEQEPFACEAGMRLWHEYRESAPWGLMHPPVCAEDVIDPDPELAAFFEHWSVCESCNEA